ncbi:outer membrane beta-barrel protein [Vibrio cincinnatiensis]|uniref:outer membrane beta-barrel protein n=1 Tax=Vibrio cincinnatiensis TaxID=675 RepID=UPI001EE110F8|nr:outer membrane beta-barrel protein [Vibrio cincinnatiensis]MCG3733105.1 hypothetical protein [Vibrio cincinnatiensis]MCG3739895.1 hypothetical protein [Vibrio cincinnatiensis]
MKWNSILIFCLVLPFFAFSKITPYLSVGVGYHELDFNSYQTINYNNLSLHGTTESISFGAISYFSNETFLSSEFNFQFSQANRGIYGNYYGEKIKVNNSYGVAVLFGKTFLDDSYSLYTKLGYQKTEIDYGSYSEDKYIGFRYGLGGQYHLNGSTAIGLEMLFTDFNNNLTEQLFMGRLVQYF